MKKVINSKIFLVIITMIIVSSGTLYAAKIYYATNVIYNSSDGGSTTVNDTLNDLYKIKTSGDATEQDILEGKTAIVQGEKITGTLKKSGVSDTLIARISGNGSYTFKKSGKCFLIYAVAGRSNYDWDHKAVGGSFYLYYNNSVIASHQTSNGSKYSWSYNSNTLTLNVNAGDTIRVTHSTNNASISNTIYIFMD